MIMIVLLLLNMLLAIVMDAYSEQKAAIGDAETLLVELQNSFIRWKGQYYGERITFGEIYKGLRIIKAEDKCWSVAVRQKKFGKSNSMSSMSSVPMLKRSLSQTNIEKIEEFKLVTVDILRHECKSLRKKQAIQVIEEAVNMFHAEKKATTNTEEMLRIIRKVNDGTRDIK